MGKMWVAPHPVEDVDTLVSSPTPPSCAEPPHVAGNAAAAAGSTTTSSRRPEQPQRVGSSTQGREATPPASPRRAPGSSRAGGSGTRGWSLGRAGSAAPGNGPVPLRSKTPDPCAKRASSGHLEQLLFHTAGAWWFESPWKCTVSPPKAAPVTCDRSALNRIPPHGITSLSELIAGAPETPVTLLGLLSSSPGQSPAPGEGPGWPCCRGEGQATPAP